MEVRTARTTDFQLLAPKSLHVTSEAKARSGCQQSLVVTELMPTALTCPRKLLGRKKPVALGQVPEPPESCSGGRLGLMGSELDKRTTLLFQL